MKRTTLNTAVIASALVIPFASAPKGSEAPPAPPAGNAPPAPPAVEVGTVSTIRKGIPIPVKKGGKGGGTSPYKANIDSLEVGDSFHVAGKTKRSLNSTMHTFNKNYRVPELDGAGQPVTEVKIGKKKDGTETRKTVAKYTEARKFEHYDVDATDPDGVGVRIFRVK